MPSTDARSRMPYLREGLLLLGFVLLLAAAAVAVVVPELSKEPEPEALPAASDAGVAATTP